MEAYKGIEAFAPADRMSWRNWLEKHHDSAKSVWLITYHKNSPNFNLTLPEAVDEALCWGWVDSLVNKRDHESAYRYFAKRNPKSNWSQVNKDKIDRLEAEGRIQPAGLEMIRIAKESGTWNALDDVEAGIVPDDLQAAFDANPKAWSYWQAFPRSTKRAILEWILTAKKTETRQKRITETVRLAAENIRANQYRQPNGK